MAGVHAPETAPTMRRDCAKLADTWATLLMRTNAWGEELGHAAEVIHI